MARWWRSTTAGRPDFGLLQERLGDASAPGLVYQAFDLLYLDGRSLLERPARGPQAAAPERASAAPASPLRGPRRRGGQGVLRGRRGAGARGHHRQAATLALRARPPIGSLAEAQDPARAGARRRRLDPGRGQRQGPGRAGRRCLRGRPAALQRQGRLRLRRADPAADSRATRGARGRRRRPSTRPRRATIEAAGAATCATSTGFARSS